MPLHGLNHYTIRPADLEKTKDFYVDALGLEVGYRPPLTFPGYWLYCGGQPTVHLIGKGRAADAGRQTEPSPTGLLDHVAFSCTGLEKMRTNLKQRSIVYEEKVIPRDRQTQIFLHDPDGVAVELNFPPHETTA